jgi:hypothetical protein
VLCRLVPCALTIVATLLALWRLHRACFPPLPSKEKKTEWELRVFCCLVFFCCSPVRGYVVKRFLVLILIGVLVGFVLSDPQLRLCVCVCLRVCLLVQTAMS